MSLTPSRRRAWGAYAVAATALLIGCRHDSATAPRQASTPYSPALALASSVDATLPILVGAGNIANCGTNGDESTAAILDTVGGTVFTAGNNVTSSTATVADYIGCYDPSW